MTVAHAVFSALFAELQDHLDILDRHVFDLNDRIEAAEAEAEELEFQMVKEIARNPIFHSSQCRLIRCFGETVAQ
jgi:hypothetical protein